MVKSPGMPGSKKVVLLIFERKRCSIKKQLNARTMTHEYLGVLAQTHSLQN